MTGHETEVAFGNRTEAVFHRWGVFVVRRRWWMIALSLVFTAAAASWLPGFVFDNSTEAFLHPDDPTSVRYREFRSRFDRDDRIVLALAPPDVFDESFLTHLRELHLALEAGLPYVEEVTSLLSARSTRGEGDELIVEDLMEGWRESWPPAPERLAGVKARVMANPLYINTLVSPDARFTTITLKPFTYSTRGSHDELAGFGKAAKREADPPLLTAGENDELLEALRAVIARFEAPDLPIHLGGPLAVTDHINRTMKREMGLFMGLAIGVVFALLFGLFRRITGALLPLLVVLFSVVASFGLMVALGIPGTLSVQILPIFLLTVGICDGVHILSIVYQRLSLGQTKEDAIAWALGHSGLAVVMTSLTTAAGMVSFASAKMAPVAQLGTIAPIGVMLALAYTLLLLPALLAVIPLSPPRESGRQSGEKSGEKTGEGDEISLLTRSLVRIGDFASDHPRKVLAACALATAFFGYHATHVRFSHLALDWFPPGDPVRVAAEVIEKGLGGSMSLEVVIDTGVPNGVQDPAFLARLEESMRWAEGMQGGDVFVSKAISIVDVLEETHQALNENQPAFRVLPSDRQLVAQELLLFENAGSDDVAELVDGQFQTARLSLRAPFVDAMLYGPFQEKIAAGLAGILGEGTQIELTGFMPVLAEVVRAMIVSTFRSYAIALLIITPMMIFLLRDHWLGVLSMLPNLVPVIFTLGLMGWRGYPIDASTMVLGSMVIGLAVDDTIHFMHKFRIYYEQTGDPKLAVRMTLTTTGSALLFTSLVLAGGFFVMSLASMTNLHNFGVLACSATAVAFVADMLMGPALMCLAARRIRPAGR